RAFVDAELVTIADANGIDQSIGFQRAIDRVLHVHLADRVIAVSQQNDRAASMFGGVREYLVRRRPDGIPDCRRTCERLLRSRNRGRASDHYAAADITGR